MIYQNVPHSHVGNVGFGLDLDFIEQFETVINIEGMLTQSRADFWRIMRYETSYGIFNHDIDMSPESAMAIVAMHPAEDPIIGSRLRERLERFVDYQVNTKLGLSWAEFVQQPTWLCDEQFRVCKLEADRLAQAAAAIPKV